MDTLTRLRMRLSELAARAEAISGALPATTAGGEQLRALAAEVGALDALLEPALGEVRVGGLMRSLGALSGRPLSSGELAAEVLAVVVPATAAERGAVVTFGDDRNEAAVIASHPESAPPAAVSRAVLTELTERQRTIRVADAGDSRFSRETSVMSLGLRSVLAAPVLVGGELWGALYLEQSAADAFDATDEELATLAARWFGPLLGARPRATAAAAATSSATTPASSSILGDSPKVVRLRAAIERLRPSTVPVLIEGESGTGKELVARALHFGGPRADRPFVAINCAAIPEGLIESELFGHERGAFTGATERKAGRFEQADGGTLFLDEISELRYDLQAKLLRVLQESSFTRIGGNATVTVDVRMVAATNRDLRAQAEAGKFREDLYYRLSVVPVTVPPLRDRPGDVRRLVDHFLAEVTASSGRRVEFEPEVLRALDGYRFPGNIRELRNLVERLVTLAEGDRVPLSDLPPYVLGERTVSLDKNPFRRYLKTRPRTNDELKDAKLAMSELYERYVKRLEGQFVQQLLEQSGGNVSQAARLAGMNRTLFHRKLRDAEIAVDDDS